MSDLIMPSDGPRVPALDREQVNAYVEGGRIRQKHPHMGHSKQPDTHHVVPAATGPKVDHANSFIFDEECYTSWPNPTDPGKTVVFPLSGFVDRTTKELLIGLVSLLNRSRYSITHHTVIGWNTISEAHGAVTAEQMLLHLVDSEGNTDFEFRTDLYSHYQITAMKIAVKLRGDAHEVSDAEFNDLRELCYTIAIKQITRSPVLSSEPASLEGAYVDAYVNGMLVELTWCILHFAGLLNKWFTVLKIADETDPERDGIDFVAIYNKVVPDSIKARNTALLGPDGWGSVPS